MKRPLILIFLFQLVQPLMAQVDWIDQDQRSRSYPAATYFSGFARLTQISSFAEDDLEGKLKESARAALSENVLVSIKSQSKNEIYNSDSYARDEFQRLTISSSNIEVSGITYKTHVDEANNAAFALAYVEKANVVATYDNLIQEKFGKVDNALEIAKQFKDKGDVKTELRIYYRLLPYIKEIESSVFILNAAGGALSEENRSKMKSLRLTVTEKISDVLTDEYNLKNGAKLIATIFKDQIENKGFQIRMTPLRYKGENGTSEFSEIFEQIQAEELKKAGFKLTSRNSIYHFIGNYWDYDKQVVTLSVSIINRQTNEYLASVDIKLSKSYLEENEIDYVP